MSGKTVQRTVHVFNPDTSETEVLTPGMKVPSYATDQLTNPKVFEADETAEAKVNDQPLPAVNAETQQDGVDGTQVGGLVADDTGTAPAKKATAPRKAATKKSAAKKSAASAGTTNA